MIEVWGWNINIHTLGVGGENLQETHGFYRHSRLSKISNSGIVIVHGKMKVQKKRSFDVKSSNQGFDFDIIQQK